MEVQKKKKGDKSVKVSKREEMLAREIDTPGLCTRLFNNFKKINLEIYVQIRPKGFFSKLLYCNVSKL